MTALVGAARAQIIAVFCPTCREDCVPMRDGTCGFCSNPVVVKEPRRWGPEVSVKCPSNTAYQRGCRCGGCVVAHRVYMRAWRERRAAA